MSLVNLFGKLPLDETSQEQVGLLRRVLQYLSSPIGYDKLLRRFRQTTVIESGTVTTVTTCGTVSNLTNFGARSADVIALCQSRASWALNVRSRIS